jgi:hypothetical protein
LAGSDGRKVTEHRVGTGRHVPEKVLAFARDCARKSAPSADLTEFAYEYTAAASMDDVRNLTP